jgi:hypothetical protein
MLYIATLGAALIAHLVLCFPAAVSRGSHPIDPFWEYVAIYIAFLSPLFSPAFEDFSDRPKIREGILATFAILAAAITAVPMANIAAARPRIGHLAGYLGVWQYEFPMIIIKTIVVSIVAVPFVICLESIGRTIWDIIRKLPPATAA